MMRDSFKSCFQYVVTPQKHLFSGWNQIFRPFSHIIYPFIVKWSQILILVIAGAIFKTQNLEKCIFLTNFVLGTVELTMYWEQQNSIKAYCYVNI